MAGLSLDKVTEKAYGITHAEALPIWTEGGRDGMKWRKTVGLWIWQGWEYSYSAVNVCYSSKRGKRYPESDLEMGYCLGVNRPNGLHSKPWGRDHPAELWGSAMETGLPPQWAWRAERQTKEDYSQALRSVGIHLARFCTFLGPITFPFFPFSFFWDENVYPLSVPQLYFGST